MFWPPLLMQSSSISPDFKNKGKLVCDKNGWLHYYWLLFLTSFYWTKSNTSNTSEYWPRPLFFLFSWQAVSLHCVAFLFYFLPFSFLPNTITFKRLIASKKPILEIHDHHHLKIHFLRLWPESWCRRAAHRLFSVMTAVVAAEINLFSVHCTYEVYVTWFFDVFAWRQ